MVYSLWTIHCFLYFWYLKIMLRQTSLSIFLFAFSELFSLVKLLGLGVLNKM